MEPQREKNLQRTLQIFTAMSLFLIGFVVWKGFMNVTLVDETKMPAEKISRIGKTSVLEDAKPKKVRRPETPVSDVSEENNAKESETKNVDETRALYEKRAAENPQDPAAYRMLGKLALQEKDYRKAEGYFDLALQLNPDDEKTFLGSIRSLLGQRKFLETEERLKKETSLSPHFELYRGLLAALFNRAGEAKTHLEQAAQGNDPIVQEKAKRVLDAYAEFAFTTDGAVEHLQALLAKSFDQIGEYQMAISLALDALKSKEDYRDVWIIIGHASLAEEKYVETKAALERAIELDGSNAIAHVYLGLAHTALNEHREAITAFEKAESFKFPAKSFLATQKAKSFDALEEFNEAYEWYRIALKEKGEKSSSDEYIRPMFIAIEKLRAPEKAYLLATMNFSFRPKDARSFNLLGWTNFALGKFDDAKRYLERSLALDPTLAAPYFNLGNLYETLGNQGLAKSHFERAEELAKETKDKSIEVAARNKLQSYQTPPL